MSHYRFLLISEHVLTITLGFGARNVPSDQQTYKGRSKCEWQLYFCLREKHGWNGCKKE